MVILVSYDIVGRIPVSYCDYLHVREVMASTLFDFLVEMDRFFDPA